MVLFQSFCFEFIYFWNINKQKNIVSIIMHKNFLPDLERSIECNETLSYYNQPFCLI